MRQLLLISCIAIHIFCISQSTNAPTFYKFSLAFKAYQSSEKFVLNDPQNRISRIPLSFLALGTTLSYNYDRKNRILFDYQRDPLGAYAFFNTPQSFQINGKKYVFSRVALMLESDIFPRHNKSKLNLYARAGPSFSFTRSPNGSGFTTTGYANASGNILSLIEDSSRVNRSSFLSLGGAIGLRYNFNQRFYISGNITRFWNVSSNDISFNYIRYKPEDLAVSFDANIRTTGNIRNIQFALGYNFSRNEKRTDRKIRVAKANEVADSTKRFAILFNASTNYSKIRLQDPAGYLTSAPHIR